MPFHKIHGMSGTRVHRAWKAMLSRCRNPNNVSYPRYGGRGITVCEKWSSFESFLLDMGEPPAGASLDRIDNSKGYCKENCRWSSASDQARNRRSSTKLEMNGEVRSMIEWAEMYSIPYERLQARLNLGWPLDLALTTPLHVRLRKAKQAKTAGLVQ